MNHLPTCKYPWIQTICSSEVWEIQIIFNDPGEKGASSVSVLLVFYIWHFYFLSHWSADNWAAPGLAFEMLVQLQGDSSWRHQHTHTKHKCSGKSKFTKNLMCWRSSSAVTFLNYFNLLYFTCFSWSLQSLMQICCMFPAIEGAHIHLGSKKWISHPALRFKTSWTQKSPTKKKELSIPNLPSKNCLYSEYRPFLTVPQTWNWCQNHRWDKSTNICLAAS